MNMCDRTVVMTLKIDVDYATFFGFMLKFRKISFALIIKPEQRSKCYQVAKICNRRI